jgi:hypothetical protein
MMRFARTLPFAVLVAIVACSDNESPPVDHDHTPVEYDVLVNGAPASGPYTFTAGQTDRVQIKFFNEAGEDLDEVESSHFGGLIFEPASLATVVRVADHNYQFDVTGGTPGSGTLVIGFGHEETADEVTFPSEPVTVNPGGGGPIQ